MTKRDNTKTLTYFVAPKHAKRHQQVSSVAELTVVAAAVSQTYNLTFTATLFLINSSAIAQTKASYLKL